MLGGLQIDVRMRASTRVQNDKEYCMSVRTGRCYDVPAGATALAAANGQRELLICPRGGTRAAGPFLRNKSGFRRLSYSLLRAGVLASGLGLAAAAHALALGELVVQSGLGQPFVGTVRYTNPRGEEVQPLCIRTRSLASPSLSGLPDLPDPRIEVQPGPGGGVITIRTARPIDEPLMRLQLAVNCGPSSTMSREFIVALDPPRADAPLLAPAPVAAAAAGARAVTTTRPALPNPSTGAAAQAPVSPEAAAAARAERDERRRLRRARSAAGTPAAAPAAPASRQAAALPYEPGVTPPPGRRGARAQPRPAAEPQYRLSLSRPVIDEPLNPNLALRGSDSLESLNRPGAAITPAQRDKLRFEARVRMAEDPVALSLQMQERLGGLETGLADLRGQLSGFRKEREDAARRIAQLEDEKRSLSAWLNGMALALGFIGCVAIAALLFWNYRRRAEQNDARARRMMAAEAAVDKVVAVAPAAARAAARAEATLEEEFDDTPWRPEQGAEADAADAADASETARMAAAPLAKPSAAAAPAFASLNAAATAAKPKRGTAAALPRFAPTPPVATGAAVPPAAADAAAQAAGVVPQFKATPPAPQGTPDDDSYTATLEIPRPAAAGPVGEAHAAPPLGAGEREFRLEETAEAAETAEEEDARVLPAITFELDLPGALPAPELEEADAPRVHGEPIEFSMDTGALAPQPEPPHAPPPAATVDAFDDPFGGDPAPPPPPSLAVTYAAPAASRAPTPTMASMQMLVDELAAAQLADPSEATQPDALPATGAHRTLDIDLGGDGDAEMRAQLYRQEFELKLFPEIVHGQAKLKVPQSIISLARTYYQEDFDTNRAINLLEYAADRTPDPQRVRLALLEILRMEGMSREYVAVSRSFHQQFPDAEEWDTVSAYGRLLAPQQPLFKDADVTGYDLNMPSMWLGSTLDMTRYVLAQDMHDAMHGPVAETEENA